MNTIFKMSNKKVLATFSALFLMLFVNMNTALAADGKKIFKQNCAVCHSLSSKKITGPGLAGIADRVPQPSEDWLKKWIKNNKAVIASGDEYANSLNPTGAMPAFTFLTDEELTDLVKYISNPPVDVAPVKVETGGPVVEAEEGVDPLAIVLGVIAFMIIVAFVLRGVSFSLKNLANQKEGLPLEEKKSLFKEMGEWMNGHRAFTAVVIIALVAGGVRSGWYTLKNIGVYGGEGVENYHPEQPIAFSHKIHAGDNGIDCQYCHSTVEKSKTASIPTVNICMNCHKGIAEGPSGPKGTAEIAKIYEAAGFDDQTGEYTKPEKPIEWVKVHNLPDFVFFSHQQHVKVGKQDCANCHGDVKTMTTAEQVSPLTMAWCIDCHRETEVPGMQDNPYYERLHKKLAAKYKDQPITVDKMGGIECAKCHY